MKFNVPSAILLSLLLSASNPFHLSAVITENDRTLSPYFYVPGGDESVDRLPLKSTEVDVQISGVIADVRILQEYQNLGSSSLNACRGSWLENDNR
jgi:Ca-activated chloride channel homolog